MQTCSTWIQVNIDDLFITLPETNSNFAPENGCLEYDPKPGFGANGRAFQGNLKHLRPFLPGKEVVELLASELSLDPRNRDETSVLTALLVSWDVNYEGYTGKALVLCRWW